MYYAYNSGPDGNSVVSGHLDGSIHRFTFETETSGVVAQRFARVPGCAISAVGWGVAGVAAAGNDQVVRFFAPDGREAKTFDYSGTKGVKEFSCCRFNPSGEAVVFGNHSRYFVFAWAAAPARRGLGAGVSTSVVRYHSRERIYTAYPNIHIVSTCHFIEVAM